MSPVQQGDSLRVVLHRVFAAPKYRWTVAPDPLARVRRWIDGFSRWINALRDQHPAIFHLVANILFLVLVFLLVHWAWRIFRRVRNRVPELLPSGGAHIALRDQAWYRREADRLAASGYFAEAIQADFLGLILRLDALGVVRFHPGKTPAEYVNESRLSLGARHELGDLVTRLYAYAFARVRCGADEFADWRQRATTERYASAH